MKIAIANLNGNLSEHFGHCESFSVFEIENGKVLRQQNLPNPEHQPGFLPRFLADQGIQTVICSGIGAGALERFQTLNIEVVSGASGSVVAVLTDYLAGKLKPATKVCHEHQHHGNC